MLICYLNVSVTVLSGGVPEMEVDDSRMTAGSVSMLETRLLWSKIEAVEVKMFSGGGIVSVWKSGDFVADGVNFRVVVDEGSATLLVNVRVTVMNLKIRFIHRLTSHY